MHLSLCGLWTVPFQLWIQSIDYTSFVLLLGTVWQENTLVIFLGYNYKYVPVEPIARRLASSKGISSYIHTMLLTPILSKFLLSSPMKMTLSLMAWFLVCPLYPALSFILRLYLINVVVPSSVIWGTSLSWIASLQYRFFKLTPSSITLSMFPEILSTYQWLALRFYFINDSDLFW